MNENFADGKTSGKSRPGRVKRAGASCKGSVTSLRKKAKKYGGEKGKMYHWCANMKHGRKKMNKESIHEMTICNACAIAMLEDIRDGVIETPLMEAEYRGRKVKLNKPMRGDVKKFKVYVKDPKTGNVKKVNFGHGGISAKKAGQKTMRIRKNNPKARKSFRARHNCDNPGPKTKARYWSCRKW